MTHIGNPPKCFFVEFLHDKNGTTTFFVQSKSRDLVPLKFQHLITSISYELVGQVGVWKKEGQDFKFIHAKDWNLIVQHHHKYWFLWCSRKMQVNTRERLNMVNNEDKSGSHTLKSCGLRNELEMFILLCWMEIFFKSSNLRSVHQIKKLKSLYVGKFSA